MTHQFAAEADLDSVVCHYRDTHLDEVSDRALAARVAESIAIPKVAPADSFVLHAPLELLARTGLLRYVQPEHHENARLRVAWLGATYEAAGDGLRSAPGSFSSLEDAARSLVSALDRGEIDDVDRAADWLGTHASPQELRERLGATIVTSLAAAAHGSIFLHLLNAISPGGELTGRMLRGPARELGRYPEWRLTWFDEDLPEVGGPLADALLQTPYVGLPGSDFIFPIMHQAEETGLAAKLLSGLRGGPDDAALARNELTRVAAWSMLQEDELYAPYGWSHCLTMPQAVMALAGEGVSARAATLIAGTYVVGFRAAMGRATLAPQFEPQPSQIECFDDAIETDRDEAAAWVYHAPSDRLGDVVTRLATLASEHHDAHLVKYVLASLHAATSDSANARLYLASAASLAAYWAQQPSDGFFD